MTFHSHKHSSKDHDHTHGVADPILLTTQRGIWAIKWSCWGLLATALIQGWIVYLSGSVALLADTLHNVGDAMTAFPLWVAFLLARWKPTNRFTYGYGRVEDLAGIIIVLTILSSALVVGYESIDRFFHPRPVEYLGAVVVAAIVGFLGNEAVARLRLKVGKEIGSAALIADGYHARADGLTSLAVLFSALGIWLNFPLADPLIGLLITLVILKIAWGSCKTVFLRLLDAVDPDVVVEIKEVACQTKEVVEITETRVRWLGHRLHAELNLAVSSNLTIEQGHDIAMEVRHNLLHHLQFLSNCTIHIDPATASGKLITALPTISTIVCLHIPIKG